MEKKIETEDLIDLGNAKVVTMGGTEQSAPDSVQPQKAFPGIGLVRED